MKRISRRVGRLEKRYASGCQPKSSLRFILCHRWKGPANLTTSTCQRYLADGLLIEVHPNPAEAWSDGGQQLTLEGFARLMESLKPFIAAAGRE